MCGIDGNDGLLLLFGFHALSGAHVAHGMALSGSGTLVLRSWCTMEDERCDGIGCDTIIILNICMTCGVLRTQVCKVALN